VKRLGALLAPIVALAIAGCSSSVGTTPAPGRSAPSSGSIAHIVIMVQENRSFNNLFAGFPGAVTAMQGLCKPPAKPPKWWCKTAREVTLKAIPLAEGSPSLGGDDICHSHLCFVTECDPDAAKICQNDGFDLIVYGEASNGLPARLYPYSYVRHSDVKAYWDLAQRYTLADEMFFTETASSFVSHQVLLSGSVELNDAESLTDQPNLQPWGCDAPGPHSGPKQVSFTPILFKNDRYGRLDPRGPFPCFTYPTVADLLDAKKVSWRFYADAPYGREGDASGFTWNGYRAIHKIFYGPDWKANISSPNTKFFTDLNAGALPAVSWVIPSLYDSDHPASGCNGGPRWVTQVVNAIGKSQYWKNTAIILVWDDWGGWYDPVPAPWVSYTRLGFRVPMIVISPYAKPHNVSHTHYDFGSILKFVEQTFHIGSLGTADATANSMQDVFDFTQTPNAFKAAPLPRVNGDCDGALAGRDVMQRILKLYGGPPD
jgi:phospholipase C